MITAIICSSLVLSGCGQGESIEIVVTPDTEMDGGIFITGAIVNPGYYPLTGDDDITVLIRDVGGTTGEADLNRMQLHIPEKEQAELPQRININRAEAWLFEALPGIGPTRAKAIVDYRQANGLFRSTDEITRVENIGSATYEQIKHLITIAD